VVCSSKLAAVKYRKYILAATAKRLKAEKAKPVWSGGGLGSPEQRRLVYRHEVLCRRIAFLKAAVVVSSEGTNEDARTTTERKYAKAVGAVENFKRVFDYQDPHKGNTGVAFLILCDMLLTGFDAPIEQVEKNRSTEAEASEMEHARLMPVYGDIPYSLKRSKRKTGSIYVERDGSVSVRVPEGLTDAQIEALIEEKRAWIYRNLAEWRALNAERVERDYVNGEGFLYLGRSY
jgi:hypothetical protein